MLQLLLCSIGILCAVGVNEERYKKLIANMEEGKVFDCGEVKMWKCRNCGHIHIGTSAPAICPVCSHPKAYFEIKAENY